MHLEQGWPIAAFFLVVGACQVTAAALLLKPCPPAWFWLGIAGSATVIGIWVVSRTVGVPFAEDGHTEPVGVADSFASLAEAWTIIMLALYLAEPIRRWRRAIFGLGAVFVLGLPVVWVAAADVGLFNGDPARFTAPVPPLIDWLVAASGVALAGGLLIAARAPLQTARLRGLMRGLIGATALAVFAQVWLTLPPTIGQNLDCRYAPLSSVLIGRHTADPEPVRIGEGQRRVLPLFELRACEAVALDRVEPVTVIGEGATVESFWLLPEGTRLGRDGQAALPAQARTVPPGDRIEPGGQRQLVVRLVGTGAGDYVLGSVRLNYHTDEPGAFSFATQIFACSGLCAR